MINVKEDFKKHGKTVRDFLLAFLKWVFVAALCGVVGGFIGMAFDKSVNYVSGLFSVHSWLLFLLPVGGVVIVLLYRLFKMDESVGTNNIITSVRTGNGVPIVLAPLIFVSTVITHLCGGSAGREGAALQLGGTIGAKVGTRLKMKPKDENIAIMCGMSAVFSALFGTPVTASVLAMEVTSVGVMYYAGFLPCVFSSIIAVKISSMFGVEPFALKIVSIPQFDFFIAAKIVLIAAVCAGVSILFCFLMKTAHRYAQIYLKNQFVRAIVGGCAIILLTLILNSRDYNGTGIGVIERAVNTGQVKPEAFALKLIFTVITMSCGYKGGEIIPTFFIGATLGGLIGGIIGLDVSLAAAIGLISLFCGVINCPLASLILSVEVFGSQGILYFVIACAVSYMLSGYYGLYSSQKIMYSKLRAELININTK